MKNIKKLSASLEDYLEAIYHIIEEKDAARGKDIAARLKVSRGSVTEALRLLSKKGLINYAPYEVITMTENGSNIARDVIKRHTALKRFFVEVLAIENEVAERGACEVEHIASPQIISRMVKFMDFLENCPRGGTELLSGFANYCTKKQTKVDCDHCSSQCSEIKGF
ncbi:MAG: metal-dependent transcriptional regulator [Desulfobulbaceae bacterium]|nr:metal-dependent transcriptional regulator [Desulfobulbaceae bacterium]